jgi:hypothetical protein
VEQTFQIGHGVIEALRRSRWCADDWIRRY